MFKQLKCVIQERIQTHSATHDSLGRQRSPHPLQRRNENHFSRSRRRLHRMTLCPQCDLLYWWDLPLRVTKLRTWCRKHCLTFSSTGLKGGMCHTWWEIIYKYLVIRYSNLHMKLIWLKYAYECNVSVNVLNMKNLISLLIILN